MADDNTAEKLAEEAADIQAAEEGQEQKLEAVADIEEEVSEEKKAADRNLELILDVPLKVTVELGRTKMVVSELLNLGQGSVVELNKLAGEPMEVLVNDKLVARGEAVVVNEKFGIRLTDIISPTERVEQLA